ncbi:MAG: dipeptidase [Bacteroidales bacterium]|nr:dipeptidase [Bacteroidales bacterium]
MEKFADLHCHPHFRSFNWLRHTKFERKNEKFHPWHIVVSKVKAIEKGKRANAYSQSDLIKLQNGNVKLVFISLYPMEKGFVSGRQSLTPEMVPKLLSSSINKWWLNLIIQLNKKKLANIIKAVGDDKGKKLAVRDVLQRIFQKLPTRRIQHIQGPDYNYFEELKLEKDFLLRKNNIPTKSILFFPFIKKIFLNKRKLIRKNKEFLDAEGTYEICTSGEDIQRVIDEGKIAFVFTIEGANVFNTWEDTDKIKERIRQVKDWEDTPLFFINFSHHFNNYLCGHAHSIPDYGQLILDQIDGMNFGFSPKGKEILRYFLSLDDNNNYNKELGRRILIDVKHMSAAGRQFFYEDIITKCREKGDNIPIICGHGAFSGVKTLNELISYAHKENDEDAVSTINKPFNTWNINLADEDIIEIFNSGGIIGINFDQRILAVPKKVKKRTYPDNYDIGFFWDNLKGMMDAILDYNGSLLYPKDKIVDLFGLGSDFDGYIDPLDKYPTSYHFQRLRTDLIKEIIHDPQKARYLFGLPVEDFVDRICFENAFDFAVKHFKKEEPLIV